MRFVTVNVQCDWESCETIAEESDGLVGPLQLTIDRKQTKEFLLCKPHREELNEILLPLMAKGITVETSKKTSSKSPSAKTSVAGEPGSTPSSAAPLPDHAEVPDGLRCKYVGSTDDTVCNRPMRNRAGFAQHVVRSHGFKNLAAYESEYGPVG